MEITRIGANCIAFIRPDEGANVGMLHTSAGLIVIDTTSSPSDMQTLLAAVDAQPAEVRLVVNTHSHSDHTWGNQLFDCPIWAHRECRKLMQEALKQEWSPQQLMAYVTELEKTDPQKAAALRQTLLDLRIKIPGEVFEDLHEGELGGMKFEIIHLGGHTPDLSVLWLPESRVLFASDLIFQGRYPYIFDADILLWIGRLDRLLEFNASAIVPGHGVMRGTAGITALRAYLQDTWDLVAYHIALGHTAVETSADPGFPVFAEKQRERLHQANIHYIYNQLKS